MQFDSRNLSLNALHTWERYSDSIMNELRQCTDEGRDVAQYADVCKAVSALPMTTEREELCDVLYKALTAAPIRADYPYIEPDELDAIRAERPEKRPVLTPPARSEALTDKLRGAWYGRICGCLLGKPVEGMRTPDMYEILKNTNNYPLTRYMTLEDLKTVPRLYEHRKGGAWVDRLKGCAPVDDDTNYTALAAIGIIGQYGRDFTSDDVATVWLDYQPKKAYCTAERRAFRNFVIGLRPPQSATYKNPDREYIGAQIRGDYFGYINPGDPETAAEMAWRDARISHVKNGIYGEMFAATMIAAAAVTDDLETVIEAGLGEVPKKSRLAEHVNLVLSDWRNGLSEEAVFANIHTRWDEFKGYDWVHTISNAEIVTASLLYGGKDFGKSICRAVQTGFDTDCNGATVGSIIGIMLGQSGIDPVWTDPTHGILDTTLFGVNRVSIEELVQTTLGHLPA